MIKSVIFEGITTFEESNNLKVVCPRCGVTHELWFNGGELDSETCSCGTEFNLLHGRIDLQIVYPEDKED